MDRRLLLRVCISLLFACWLVGGAFLPTSSTLHHRHLLQYEELEDDQDRPTRVQPLDEGWYWCFEDKCRCQGHVANCSGNAGTLTFIPLLPPEITELDFSNNFEEKILQINDPKVVLNRDFFANVTNITSIDLSYNEILNFSNNPLYAFKRLTTFIYLFGEFDDLFPALYDVPTLKRLEFGGGIIHGRVYFERLPLLENITVMGSMLTGCHLSCFSQLKFLKQLDLIDVYLKSFSTDTPMKSLEKLSLRGSFKYTEARVFIPTCDANGSSNFPQLSALDFSKNPNFRYNSSMAVCLPKLQYLDLSESLFNNFSSNTFASWKFPSLLSLVLQDILVYKYMDKFAFNNSGLQHLSLRVFSFGKDNFDPDSFRGCPNLTHLVLSGHNFSAISDTKVQRLLSVLPSLQNLQLDWCGVANITNKAFAGLSSLRALNLSNNKLTYIPAYAFSSLTSLKTLDLSNNAIDVILDGAFLGLTGLRMLDLSGNQLTVVPGGAFSDDVIHSVTQADLSDNRLVCNCSMLWFRRWVARNESVFANSRGSYACANLNGTDVFTYRVSGQSCMFGRGTYVVMFAVSLLAVLCLLVALCVLGWRTRRNVRKFLREMVKMQRLRQALHLQPVHWDYDLFVAYAEEDADWVQEQLKARMEDEWGLRLCLHYRDFHPGRNILDNIEACLEKSRKMMVVFSPHFANSRWCQLELSVGLQHAMDRNDELLVVYLSPVPPDDLTAGMAAILRSCTYLRWAERDQEAAVFWDSLRAALPDGDRVANV